MCLCAQGFYTTSLWQGELTAATSSNTTTVLLEHCDGCELGDAAVTVAVCARYAGVTFVDTAHTSCHILDAFGSCTVDNFINIEHLYADKSIYVIDGWLCVRVFVRPLTSPCASDGCSISAIT